MNKILIILVVLLLVGCAPNPIEEILGPAVYLDVHSVCENVPLAEKDDCLLKACPELKTDDGIEACCMTIKDDSLRKKCLSVEKVVVSDSEFSDGYVIVKGSMPAGLSEGESFNVYVEFIRPGGKFSELPDAMYSGCSGGSGKGGKCFDIEKNQGVFASKVLVASNDWDSLYPTTDFEEDVYVGPLTDQYGDTQPAAVEYRVIYTKSSPSGDEDKLKEYNHRVDGPFSVG